MHPASACHEQRTTSLDQEQRTLECLRPFRQSVGFRLDIAADRNFSLGA